MSGLSNWYETFFGSDYLIVDHQPDTEAEVAFLREALDLTPGTKLLDAACGYGRHLVPLAKAGVDIVGCDLSGELLEEASRRLRETAPKKKSAGIPRLVRCDLRELPFDGIFDRACLMYTSLGYFDREDDNFRVLSSLRSALRDGGLLLIETVNRDFFLRTMTPKDWLEKDGALIAETRSFNVIRSRSEIDVTIVDKQGKRTYHHSIRLYTYTELSMLLEACGFDILAVYGGFHGEAFDLNASRMLILTRAVG